ncbi:unnamed protein product [Natator depressus]
MVLESWTEPRKTGNARAQEHQNTLERWTGCGDQQDRSDFVCTKCKLVSILEEKVQGLEQQVSTLRCIRETEDFLDRHQDMLLWTQHSEDSQQAALRGQEDGEEI